MPTRDTNCDKRKKECKRIKGSDNKTELTPVDVKDTLPPRYLKAGNHSSSCNVIYQTSANLSSKHSLVSKDIKGVKPFISVYSESEFDLSKI